MRILIYSHPHYAQTGFGKVVNNLVKHWKDKHEVFIAPVVCSPPSTIVVDGVTVLPLPATLIKTPYWVNFWCKELKIDLVVQHFDVWMLPKGWIHEICAPVVTYAPVDVDRLPLNFVESCQGAATNVAMTKHAKRLFDDALLPSIYIPHGVDLNIYKPEPKKFFDCEFIIGLVQTNGSVRKNIAGQLEAFAKFAKDNDAKLLMHTQSKKVHGEGIDIFAFASSLDIADKIVITDSDLYAVGCPESYLPMFYNSCDVLLQCTLGEGFGLPIIEAQACGVPVIGTHHSVIKEVIGKGGIYCQGEPIMFPYNMGNMQVPSQDQIVKCLSYIKISAYAWKQSAIKNAAQYSWDNIYPLWDKLLEGYGKVNASYNV